MNRSLRNISWGVRMLVVTNLVSFGVLVLVADSARNESRQAQVQNTEQQKVIDEFRARIDILDQLARAHDTRSEALHRHRHRRTTRAAQARRTSPVASRSPVADVPPQPPPPPPAPPPPPCTLPNPLGGCLVGGG